MTVSADDALDEKIRNAAEEKTLPSGEPMRVIGHPRARKLAASENTSLGRLYSRAAAGGVFPERFLRNAKALSARDQARCIDSDRQRFGGAAARGFSPLDTGLASGRGSGQADRGERGDAGLPHRFVGDSKSPGGGKGHRDLSEVENGASESPGV